MLAQASLGLLLFERQEQESRASLSNGEDSHNLKLRDKASLNFHLLDFDIKSNFFSVVMMRSPLPCVLPGSVQRPVCL